MKTISIRELHNHTGNWVRKADEEKEIIITNHGQPIAALHPLKKISKINPFLNRKLLPGIKRIMKKAGKGNSSDTIISEDRDR